jgi:uncharacterized protein YdiU (UPF0061 family)
MQKLEKIILQNSFIGLGKGFYSYECQEPLNKPFIVHLNNQLMKELGLSSINPKLLMDIFNGTLQVPQTQTISMNYAGHQFGQYVKQLGDGRGILIGEVKLNNKKFDIHVKGSGKTNYSRFGDGRAVLRSSLREYLCGEAMHFLNIPSSRSLMIFSSKDPVYREKTEDAAIIARTAKTHIRFGNFEKYFYEKDYKKHLDLSDYVISEYCSEISTDNEEKYVTLLSKIVLGTAELIARWQAVGFCHGVMNTDNMSVLGETLDYGPYGFMDTFNPSHICNLSDTSGRYSYENQPYIGLWNCSALAHTFEKIVDKTKINHILSSYESRYAGSLLGLYRNKLGLKVQDEADENLIQELLNLMKEQELDYTRTFRSLSNIFKKNNSIEVYPALRDWSIKLKKRHQKEDTDVASKISLMNKNNPKYILRNYLLQIAIDKAEEGSYKEIDNLMHIIRNPFNEIPDFETYAEESPDWASDIGLSCSS